MHATVSLFATLCVVALARATPYYYPQQRQLFYPVVPQYQQYQPQPFYQRQVYYAAPAAANLVAPVSSALRYPLVAPAKQVVYYGAPAVAPYPSNLVYTGGADEAAGAEGGGFGSYFENFFGNFPAVFGFGQNQEAAESPSPAEGSSPAASPEKNEAASSEQPAKEGEGNKEKENEADKPAQPAKAQKVKVAAKGGAQKYVVVGQPQFFGNYPVQGVNPAAVLPAANHGAVSSYLLLKNYPGYRLTPAPHFPVVPQAPQVPQPAAPQAPQAADSSDAELIPAGQPGAAALGYQKLLQDAQSGRESKEYDDAAVVDAATPQDDKPAESGDSSDDAGDKSEDEETGTSD